MPNTNAKVSSLAGLSFGSSAFEADVKAISEKILDATSLQETLIYHREIVQLIDLEIMTRLVSDNHRDHVNIPKLRHMQGAYLISVRRLQKLLEQNDNPRWTWPSSTRS